METANSTVVLPSVELTSSHGGISDELVHLIREKTDGLVREFTHKGNVVLKIHVDYIHERMLFYKTK